MHALTPAVVAVAAALTLSGWAAGTAAVAASTDVTATTGAATPTNPAAEGGVTLPDQALLSTASR